MPSIEDLEKALVEQPLLRQLLARAGSIEWEDADILYPNKDDRRLLGRRNIRSALLEKHVKDGLQKINKLNGSEWLDEPRLESAFKDLETLSGEVGLMERNRAATKLMLEGTFVDGPEDWGGRPQRVHFIDWENPENNKFIVASQVTFADHGKSRPDVILFVNGIPLAVIECKSPTVSEPISDAITQLLRYANSRGYAAEGFEQLFHYAQLCVATCATMAVVGPPGTDSENYSEWKDTYPKPLDVVAAELGKTSKDDLTAQEILVEGLLRPKKLLDVVRHFMVFKPGNGGNVKVIPRYHQYRSVSKIVQRLENGATPTERGGLIYHTQGSGKSLSMAFLVRKMRSTAKLAGYKIVFVTDRTQLQDQLSGTMTLSGEHPETITHTSGLAKALSGGESGIWFLMLQKNRDTLGKDSEEEGEEAGCDDFGGVVNISDRILIIADEAHRGHSRRLHANLRGAFPNSTMLGFTGTPILVSDKKKTTSIFGGFIDTYTMRQAVSDKATVPLHYSKVNLTKDIADRARMDADFDRQFADYSETEKSVIKGKFVNRKTINSSKRLLMIKADNMLRHFITTAMTNGMKAMVAASDRHAAIAYQKHLAAARDAILVDLDSLATRHRNLSQEEIEGIEDETLRFLAHAWHYRDVIQSIEFATVVSHDGNDPPEYREWTDEGKTSKRMARFQKPLPSPGDTPREAANKDSLAFLVVYQMLLVGFDAPIVQCLYLDRTIKGAELLQAIARANRKMSGKLAGYIVDYADNEKELGETQKLYDREDIGGSYLTDADGFVNLRNCHVKISQFFEDQKIMDFSDYELCYKALKDPDRFARFITLFSRFTKAYGIVAHLPKSRGYMQDYKRLENIRRMAWHHHNKDQYRIDGAAVGKVRRILDDHLVSRSIDVVIDNLELLSAEAARTMRKRSSRTTGSDMLHQTREDISKLNWLDPAYFGKLSEQIDEIIGNFKDENCGQSEEILSLVARAKTLPVNQYGLDARTEMPFHRLIAEGLSGNGRERLDQEGLTALVPVVKRIAKDLMADLARMDFWRKESEVKSLRRKILTHLQDVCGPKDHIGVAKPLASRILEEARQNQGVLLGQD